MKRENLKFSIVVPTYNEEKDIFRTLKALEGLDWDNYEVIVVDGNSQDRTIEIAETFTRRLSHFSLLFQPESNRKGVAEARNIGIRAAKGKVVVILNADVILPRNFLNQIAHYYKEDKHWVAVTDKIMKSDNMYSRFEQADHNYLYKVRGAHWVWTEGFSCTKEAALEVGLFPEAMPGFSGEDVDFGLELERKYLGARATEVVVPHIAPDNFSEFFWQMRARGKGRTNYYRYMKNFSVSKLFLNTLLSSGWRILKMICLLPVFYAWKITPFSEKKRKDFLSFIFAGYLKELGMLVGMWQGFFRIVKVESF